MSNFANDDLDDWDWIEGIIPMTPKERQAIQDKHKACKCGHCFMECSGCVMPWPCDAIKALDEINRLKRQARELLAVIHEINADTYADRIEEMRRILTRELAECDHQTKPSSTVARVFEMGVACPLCGEAK